MKQVDRTNDDRIWEARHFRKKGMIVVEETATDGTRTFTSVINCVLPELKAQGQIEVEFDEAASLDEAFASFPEAHDFARDILRSAVTRAMLEGKMPPLNGGRNR